MKRNARDLTYSINNIKDISQYSSIFSPHKTYDVTRLSRRLPNTKSYERIHVDKAEMIDDCVFFKIPRNVTIQRIRNINS